jgi:hypothetical protein
MPMFVDTPLHAAATAMTVTYRESLFTLGFPLHRPVRGRIHHA